MHTSLSRRPPEQLKGSDAQYSQSFHWLKIEARRLDDLDPFRIKHISRTIDRGQIFFKKNLALVGHNKTP